MGIGTKCQTQCLLRSTNEICKHVLYLICKATLWIRQNNNRKDIRDMKEIRVMNVEGKWLTEKERERRGILIWSDKQKDVFYKKNPYTLLKCTMRITQRHGTCNSASLSSHFELWNFYSSLNNNVMAKIVLHSVTWHYLYPFTKTTPHFPTVQ